MPSSSEDERSPSTSSTREQPLVTERTHPRALLAQYGLRPKKRLGQHFLMDAGVAARIAALCVQAPGERVIEIGAGTGALTQALLAAQAALTAVEIDAELIEILRARPALREAKIVQADALALDIQALTGGEPWCAAGNLPYNIATPLIAGWLELAAPPKRIVVMVQRDVADRFVAKPATAAYGSLTVAVNYAMHVRRAFTLKPEAFFPKPGVDSAVVVMERRAVPAVSVRDHLFFGKVVRAAFAYRRKTLANSIALALGIERSRTQQSLARLGYDTEIRGEQLDLDAFGALADDLVA
ncbi:MAG TPA: 16S rRNA (adenine(1518)-N(6)/adenine(1519)-N(6))-dimethyltransferase RsmA [Candidatus Acidoferrales bacterium]|nr:16S rRNA (adenine(1518)-N(6)/adenine(1519)-N(6))-dimethyltransferase RsmA [Candidatus Acidoferrales bacterium]